jgi:hypothetical protein
VVLRAAVAVDFLPADACVTVDVDVVSVVLVERVSVREAPAVVGVEEAAAVSTAAC